MSGTPSYYIVAVAGGKCLENTQTNHGVLDCVPKDDDKQKWILETNGSDPNVVSIKNCADGKYLINTQPHAINNARIGMSDEKQEWTIEKGRFPRSCAIRSNKCTVGASYLNDYNGEYKDNHYVHMWQWDAVRDWWLTWYLIDTTSSGTFNPAQEAIGGGNAKDLEEREKALAEKEQSLAQIKKANDEQEAKLKERESKLADQSASTQKPQSTGDDGAKAKELEKREAAVEERERKVAEQEAALKKAQNEADGKKDTQAEAPMTNGVNNDDDEPDTHDLDLLKAENENLKLKLRIKDLENELENAQQQPPPSAPSTPGPKRVNGASTAKSPSPANTSKPLSKQGKDQASKLRDAAKDDGAIVFSCGHVVYPPPRKVGKKIVGILYEGMDQPHAFSPRQQAALARSGL